MKKIAIIHKGGAYVPEVDMYKEILTKYGHQVDCYGRFPAPDLAGYDVEWHIMGLDQTPAIPGRVKIHEYLSSSIPPLPHIKDRIKKYWNAKPDLRIFYTEAVEAAFKFRDQTPSLVKGPGFGAHFLNDGPRRKLYDFAYLGAMDRTRRVLDFFVFFSRFFRDHSLLAIGDPPKVDNLSARFPNIHFTGRVKYLEVPEWLRKAEYGLNLMPARFPYDVQPSNKLIEYCAVGLKIITTDYSWARNFEADRKGRFFRLAPDLSNFDTDRIEQFPFVTPDVSDLTFEKSIERSGILDFLKRQDLNAV